MEAPLLAMNKGHDRERTELNGIIVDPCDGGRTDYDRLHFPERLLLLVTSLVVTLFFSFFSFLFYKEDEY
jgi:hypothetical protein